MVYNSYIHCRISFANVLLGIFAFVFIRGSGGCFLVMSLFGLGIRIMLASSNEFRSIPFASVF